MAGDILLYQTDLVPIGDDQRQHLELARDIAERFNFRYGETFRVPDGQFPEIGGRIMDLQEPTNKMSTTMSSEQGAVYVGDAPDVIRKKFKTAVTDSEREIRYDPKAKTRYPVLYLLHGSFDTAKSSFAWGSGTASRS